MSAGKAVWSPKLQESPTYILLECFQQRANVAWSILPAGPKVPNRQQTYCFPRADNKRHVPGYGRQTPESLAPRVPPGARRLPSLPASRERSRFGQWPSLCAAKHLDEQAPPPLLSRFVCRIGQWVGTYDTDSCGSASIGG